MVYILALAAALSNALISILQRMGVEDAGASDTLKLLAHRPRPSARRVAGRRSPS